MSKKDVRHNRNNTVGKGFILLIIGAFFLLRNMDLNIPEWTMSCQMLMIGIGAIIWFSSEFKNNAGVILMLVGGIFLAKDLYTWPYDISRFIWPAALMFAGVFFIFRRQSGKSYWHNNKAYKEKYHDELSYTGSNIDDYLDVHSIFSGVNRIVMSKQFKGGRVSAVFGGSDINLTQADFTGTIEIEADCVFGGVEIVVPSNWEVKVHMNAMFGGIEDNRPKELITSNPDKILIIKGNCVFGGIEIKSYK